jgi:hypothetical protein
MIVGCSVSDAVSRMLVGWPHPQTPCLPWRCCRCHDLAPTRGLSLDMAAELSPAAANWRAAHVTDAPGNIRFRQCRDCSLARRPCGTATSCRARSQSCTRAGACRRKLSPAGVSEAPALLRTKSGRRSCSSKDRIRALTAGWLTFRRSAARTKLLVATMARKVRASSIYSVHVRTRKLRTPERPLLPGSTRQPLFRVLTWTEYSIPRLPENPCPLLPNGPVRILPVG